MITKDPFKPLIFILVAFSVIYAIYSIVYKRRFDFNEENITESEVDITDYDNEYYEENNQSKTENRSRRSYDQHGSGESLPVLILVLASNARSGSTLLAELLSTTGEAVQFFEPLWPYRNKPKFFIGKTVSSFLSELFQCNFSEEFETFLRDTFPFSQYFHQSILNCLSDRSNQECLKSLDLKKICQNAKVRVAKVVRARLSAIEDLLQRSSPPFVKVIHLTRDPRGSITSMQSLFWNWKPSSKCEYLWEDMQVYDRLVQKYPESLINITHEELSLHPTRTMEKLNRFLHGTPDISIDTRRYIKRHMNSTRYQEDPLSTFNTSQDKYQSWRWKINGRLLSEIENEPTCRKVIERYGHNLFGSLDKVTDPRIPLEVSDEGPSEEVLQMYTQS
ncbi:carbohydrate sulfotransferase 1-like [Palaemon carinicauda]|uniref:carbohydrate sulfotransferase 1-like n=1 Tax=Palaemon carinicauda TaxID=392227 RepID=UPI0035B57928